MDAHGCRVHVSHTRTGAGRCGTWEDLDGEWCHHLIRNGIMETGWKNGRGNTPLPLSTQDGSLWSGWQSTTVRAAETGTDYDPAGNAMIQWFQDKGKWYWSDCGRNDESRRLSARSGERLTRSARTGACG
ncbi:MAG: hypothetical protein ACLUAR_17655 [Pilosibacter sp.]